MDVTSGNILLHKPLGEKRRSPVSWLCFDDRAVVQKSVSRMSKLPIPGQKSKKQVTEEPGLFVGLMDGRIFYIALRTGQVDSITIQGAEEVDSQLSSILLLDGTGAPVMPDGIAWEEFSRPASEDRTGFSEDVEEEEFELVIRNLDEERNTAKKRTAEPEPAEKQEVTPQDEKYLLVCAGNTVSIYKLPSYRLYSSFECENTPQCANVVELGQFHQLFVSS